MLLDLSTGEDILHVKSSFIQASFLLSHMGDGKEVADGLLFCAGLQDNSPSRNPWEAAERWYGSKEPGLGPSHLATAISVPSQHVQGHLLVNCSLQMMLKDMCCRDPER